MRGEILRLEKIITVEDDMILLNNFNLHIFKGEIMGLIPINLHGLESLIDLICKNVPLYYGYVYFREKLVNSYSHSSLLRNQAALIEKQSRLMENLTVSDNIYVMRPGFKKYIINPKILNEQLKTFAMDVGVNLHGEQQVEDLTYYEKCVVELLRAVIGGARLIIIRDISNFISTVDLTRFYKLMQRYTELGVSFLYICSHHQEAFAVCDKICLMEDGKALKVLEKDEFKEEKILPYTSEFYRSYSASEGLGNEPPKSFKNEKPVLEFCNVSSGAINDLTFNIKAGECAVLLDMNNIAHKDLLALMNHERIPQKGEILINGEPLSRKTVKSLGFIPEKPIQNSLFKEMSYLDNLCFTADKKQMFFWMRKALKKSIVKEYEAIVGQDIHTLDITKLSVQSLYSLIYHRIHLQNPAIAVCVNPFAGGDMYLRLQILSLIKKLKDKNITVLILAVNLSDSLMVADRLLVLENGSLKNEFRSGEYHKLTEIENTIGLVK